MPRSKKYSLHEELDQNYEASKPAESPASSAAAPSADTPTAGYLNEWAVPVAAAETQAPVTESAAERRVREAEAKIAELEAQIRELKAKLGIKGTTHTIVSGDTLWGIADRYLGDGSRWPEIYKANKDVIGDNPNLIRVGQELVIPGPLSAT